MCKNKWCTYVAHINSGTIHSCSQNLDAQVDPESAAFELFALFIETSNKKTWFQFVIIEVIMATQSKTIILTIVRHGATDANKQGIAHGSTDTPLNSLGLRQAKGKLISKHFFYHCLQYKYSSLSIPSINFWWFLVK